MKHTLQPLEYKYMKQQSIYYQSGYGVPNQQAFHDDFESNESFKSIDQVEVIPLDEVARNSNIQKSTIKSQIPPSNGTNQYRTSVPLPLKSQAPTTSKAYPNYQPINQTQYVQTQPYSQQSFVIPKAQAQAQVPRTQVQKEESFIVDQDQMRQSESEKPLPVLLISQKPPTKEIQYEEVEHVIQRGQSQDDVMELSKVGKTAESPRSVEMRKTQLKERKSQLLSGGKIKKNRTIKPYRGHDILQIVKKDPKGKFVVVDELYDVLGDIEAQVCLVVVSGCRVSGKSFLLNQILELEQDKKVENIIEQQFVSSQMRDGIWMNTNPIIQGDKQYFFLESPGGEYMSITLIIASLLVFNVLGNVDKDSLVSLLELTKLVDAQKSGVLSYNTPQLIWLLRDNAPEETIPSSRQIEDLFKIREKIQMPPPANTNDISQILKLEFKQLSKEFASQILALKSRIIDRGLTKQLNGVTLNGRMTFSLVEEAVDIANKKSLDFALIWKSVSEKESIEAFNQSIDVYTRALKTFFNDDQPKSFEEMQVILRDIRDAVHERFQRVAGMEQKNMFYAPYLKRLNDMIDQKDKQAFQLNEEIAAISNQDILNSISADILKNIQDNLYTANNIDSFNNEFNNMLISYETLGTGFEKSYALVQFLTAFHKPTIKTLFENCRKNLEANSKKDVNFDKEELYFRTKIKELEERQYKLEQEIKKKSSANLAISQELKGGLNNDEMQREIDLQQREIETIPQLKQNLKLKNQEIKTLKDQVDQIKRRQDDGCEIF